MQKLEDDVAGGDQVQVSLQKLKQLPIQQCILILKHACQCRDVNCCKINCQNMKRIVSHDETCKLKVNGSCAVCKQFIILKSYHAKYCLETKCPLPFCLNMKYRLNQQRMAQQSLKRLIATMQNHNMTEVIRQTSPDPSNQPSPVDSNGTKRPNDNCVPYPKKQKLGDDVALARQSSDHTYSKISHHIPQIIPGTSMQQRSAPGGVGLPQIMSNPGTSMQQRSAPGGVGLLQFMSNRPGTSALTPMLQRSDVQVLQQLLTHLRTKNSIQQKLHILHILGCPQIEAAFIKQRQQLQQQQQPPPQPRRQQRPAQGG